MSDSRAAARSVPGSLSGGVAQGAVVERHLTLDRHDVHDRTLPGLNHVRNDGTVDADRAEQVELQLVVPAPVTKSGVAAAMTVAPAS